MSLADRLRDRDSVMPASERLDAAACVVSGLQAIHDAGWVRAAISQSSPPVLPPHARTRGPTADCSTGAALTFCPRRPHMCMVLPPFLLSPQIHFDLKTMNVLLVGNGGHCVVGDLVRKSKRRRPSDGVLQELLSGQVKERCVLGFNAGLRPRRPGS